MTCPICDTSLEERCAECGASLSVKGDNEVFNKNFLIVGEGEADRQFFTHLMNDRGITKFEATNPAKGKTTFWRRLRAIRANARVAEIELVLLVRDSNGNPDEAFKEVQEQIRKVGGYGVPKEPLEVAKAAGSPAVAVLLIPWADKQGCLETVLLDAFAHWWPTETALVGELVAKCPTKDLDVSGRSKALVGALIACVCKNDPSCSVSSMWWADKGLGHILAHSCFNPIVDYLNGL